MDYVFRVGPVETTDGETFIYFIDASDEESPDPVLAESDEQALSQIAQTRSGRPLSCEPRLEAAGRSLGFTGVGPDQMQAHRMGLVAFDMLLGDELGEIEADGALYQFGVACGKLWSATSWKEHFANQALVVEMSGALDAVWELAVTGGEGEEYVFVLYPEVGRLVELQRLVKEDKVEEAAKLGSLGVSLQAEPAWAAEIFSTVYDLPLVPHPTKVAGGERAYLTDTDLITLAAALQAIAILEPGDPGATGRVKVGEIEVAAHVVAPSA